MSRDGPRGSHVPAYGDLAPKASSHAGAPGGSASVPLCKELGGCLQLCGCFQGIALLSSLVIHALASLFPLCVPLALGHQVWPPGVGQALQGLGIMYRAEAVLQEDTILQSQARDQESRDIGGNNISLVLCWHADRLMLSRWL